MTWIIGIPTLFGTSILVSDICVTFQRGNGEIEYLDCLQKIYWLGPDILGGFAGSVNIGFKMMDFLKEAFSKAKHNEGWDIEIVSNDWLPKEASKIFNESDQADKDARCQLILASIHPTKKRGDASFPWSDVFIYSSPGFEFIKANTGSALSIGSGSQKSAYMSEIQDACNDISFKQMAIGELSAQASFLAHQMKNIMEEKSTLGISKLFQIGMISSNGPIIANSVSTTYASNGSSKKDAFPMLATNYMQFLSIQKNLSHSHSIAIC